MQLYAMSTMVATNKFHHGSVPEIAYTLLHSRNGFKSLLLHIINHDDGVYYRPDASGIDHQSKHMAGRLKLNGEKLCCRNILVALKLQVIIQHAHGVVQHEPRTLTLA